jgi:hypothetical protein
VRSSGIKSEKGSALLEVVAFAALGFGLVLSLGLDLLQTERELLELQSISRNALRAYLKDSTGDVLQEIGKYQSNSKLLTTQNISVSVTCLPAECSKAGNLIFLQLSVEDKKVQSFGVVGG